MHARIKIASYDPGLQANYFECLTSDENNDFIFISIFQILRALGKDSIGISVQELKDMIGMEFQCNWLVPTHFLSMSDIKKLDKNRWTHKEKECDKCERHYCQCDFEGD